MFSKFCEPYLRAAVVASEAAEGAADEADRADEAEGNERREALLLIDLLHSVRFRRSQHLLLPLPLVAGAAHHVLAGRRRLERLRPRLVLRHVVEAACLSSLLEALVADAAHALVHPR